MKYKDAGVDAAEATKAKELIKSLLAKHQPKHAKNIGKFAGGFKIKNASAKDYILSASVDGVGTKTKLAAATNNYRVVGYDIVAHCVNDLMVQGGTPLFFMDYIAMGSLSVDVVEQLFKGMLACAQESNVAIIGGETAEMPGIYAKDDFDLVGFIVGITDKQNALPLQIRREDIIIGINSSGLHTNGYSLIRKLIAQRNLSLDRHYPELNCSLGQALMQPHRCYYKTLKALMHKKLLKAAAHITGGGIPGNLIRILTPEIDAVITKNSWLRPPIFDFIQNQANVPEEDMYTTFNMGLGIIIIVHEDDATASINEIKKTHGEPYVIGKCSKGKGEVSVE
jgi:phosphoribosylformylglycinamidine cyclo-ligase